MNDKEPILSNYFFNKHKQSPTFFVCLFCFLLIKRCVYWLSKQSFRYKHVLYITFCCGFCLVAMLLRGDDNCGSEYLTERLISGSRSGICCNFEWLDKISELLVMLILELLRSPYKLFVVMSGSSAPSGRRSLGDSDGADEK